MSSARHVTEKAPRMLLHICCAPCSPYVVERLRRDYNVTLYFYNPNIHPESEYVLRLREAARWANQIGLPMIEGEYDPESWFQTTKGLAMEPERGARCSVCFDIRLSSSAEKAAQLGFDIYGTALTVSPYKQAAVINRIGLMAAERQNIIFIEADWKKKDGYKITTRMARELGFYRQNYCGCLYSRRSKIRPERPGGHERV